MHNKLGNNPFQNHGIKTSTPLTLKIDIWTFFNDYMVATLSKMYLTLSETSI